MTPEVVKGLQDAGFRHQCFISYPHTGGFEMPEFAAQVKRAIKEELHNRLGRWASVYLDNNIPPGAQWPEQLRENLCASVAMVAILSPVYIQEEHEWCGREWSAMEQLCATRLGRSSFTAIIPIVFRKTELPLTAGMIKPVDMSRIATKGRRYYATQEFRTGILEIVEQIDKLGSLLHNNRCKAELADFQFPTSSPFAPKLDMPPVPLRGLA